MNFNKQDSAGVSHLFLVRLRTEEIRELKDPESKRWCGRVQRVVNGEAYEFYGWADLIRRLGVMLDDPQPGNDIDANDAEEHPS